MNSLTVAIKRFPNGSGLPLPKYATPGSAGVDLMAAIDSPMELYPGSRILIPTGLAIALPNGYEAQIRPRSGLAHKNGVTVLNSPGTVDADYRGEISVILINHGDKAILIEYGMRIAQMIIAPVNQVSWNETAELPDTARGERGFGSTGTQS
tara:strand:- start:806 stop:1261 length:456 start_codon:yes stop_codon:yes gene_type:complete